MNVPKREEWVGDARLEMYWSWSARVCVLGVLGADCDVACESRTFVFFLRRVSGLARGRDVSDYSDIVDTSRFEKCEWGVRTGVCSVCSIQARRLGKIEAMPSEELP